MPDLFTLETKLIEQRTKVELNSELVEKIIGDEISKHCKELDKLCNNVKDIIYSDTEDLSISEYEQVAMKLSLLLYDLESVSEYLDIRTDVSQILQNDRYAFYFLGSKGAGTVTDRELTAKSSIQPEVVTTLIAKHIAKVIENKKNAAYNVLNTVKKIISLRISSNDYNNL